MPDQKTASSGNTTGIVLTVLGGALGLWVVTRLASVYGQQQTRAPPFARYEWITLFGAVAAVLLLIMGLVRWTRPQER